MFKLRREVYLDNNATTKPAPGVIKEMTRVLKKVYGNPSSLYKTSHQSTIILENARIQTARAINAEPSEIIFTGCATESNNTVLKSLFEHFFPEKNKIVSLPIEHPAVLSTLDYLKWRGAEIAFLNVNNSGEIDFNEFERLIDDRTFLVSCMNVNNETGIITDIKRAAQIAHSKGSLFFSDCVQALGKIPVDVKDSVIDYASFSAHKINGPKGVGALFVRSGAPIAPFMHGGHQESGLRAGTEGLHNIAGFGTAAALVPKKLSMRNHIQKLKDYFIDQLILNVKGVRINSQGKNFAPNTISVVFPGTSNDKLMAALDFRGISVSAGSACNTGDNEPSHVLRSIGLTDEDARSTLRFSLSESTSRKDIDYTLRAIGDFFADKMPSITMFSPRQANATLLLDKSTYILDVRSSGDRRSINGLPGSHEASFYGIKKYLHAIPKDKLIIVVCQGGTNSPFTCYYLRSKGYRNTGFIMTGMYGWKAANREFYDQYSGQNIVRLEEKG